MLAPNDLAALNARFDTADTAEVLQWAWDQFGPRAAIGTSFQGAGLAMLHLARRHGLRFPVFTIDTGLLFPETLALKGQLEAFFDCAIEVLTPDLTIDQQAAAHGPNLWERDPDLCCTMRKVLPLQAKLASLACWITGLRRQQADSRADVQVVELHLTATAPGLEIVKLSPMAHWSRDAVWAYLREHRIPYNPLHDRGFRSIGCQPCTRPAGADADERAGRWTGFNKTECGIHTFTTRKA
ncbi:MAG: phosphoadenylyl-sulfate reductase [Verrucomicrobia bacterium]|nr:phosphoadenylyl-sulfate reductase [Verrucomicrobiota bacterium]